MSREAEILELPQSPAVKAAYEALLAEVRKVLKARGKTVTLGKYTDHIHAIEARDRITALMTDFFNKQKKVIAAEVARLYGKKFGKG